MITSWIYPWEALTNHGQVSGATGRCLQGQLGAQLLPAALRRRSALRLVPGRLPREELGLGSWGEGNGGEFSRETQVLSRKNGGFPWEEMMVFGYLSCFGLRFL